MSDFERALVEGIFGSKKINTVDFVKEIFNVVGTPHGNNVCNWRGSSDSSDSVYRSGCNWDSKWIVGMSYCPFCGGRVRLNGEPTDG